MESIALVGTKRTVKGKANAKLRKSGKLPAVLYGYNVPTADIEINEREFAKVFKQAGESTLVNLTVDGKSQPVLIQEVHNHYLHGQPIHVDFYAVNMDQKLKAHVPLHFIGESQAIKALGGVLLKNLSEVEVECLPADLPHAFEIDISVLNTFEDAIHLRDIKVTDKVQVLGNPEELVVAVTPPRSEEELASLAEKPVEVDLAKAVEGLAEPAVAAEASGKDTKEPKEKESKKE